MTGEVDPAARRDRVAVRQGDSLPLGKQLSAPSPAGQAAGVQNGDAFPQGIGSPQSPCFFMLETILRSLN